VLVRCASPEYLGKKIKIEEVHNILMPKIENANINFCPDRPVL
jgi:hypothetical protein